LNQATNILALIPLPLGHRLRGYLQGQLKFYGSLDALSAQGKISVTDSEYYYQPYGIKLKNIAATIIARDKTINITDFVTKDVYGNTLSAAVDLSLDKNLPFKIHFTTNKFDLVNTPYL